MIAARHRSAEVRRNDPRHYSRPGMPCGWRPSSRTSRHVIKDFAQQGIIPETTIPDSGEEIAKAALCEACVLALAPGDKRTRLMAINTVLKFTKALPVQRHATTLTTSERMVDARPLRIADQRIINTPTLSQATPGCPLVAWRWQPPKRSRASEEYSGLGAHSNTEAELHSHSQACEHLPAPTYHCRPFRKYARG